MMPEAATMSCRVLAVGSETRPRRVPLVEPVDLKEAVMTIRSLALTARSAAIVAALFLSQAALAQSPSSSPASPSPAAAAQPAPGRGGPASGPQTDLHRLPPDSTTSQKLVLPDRTLSFEATAGSIRLYDGKGEPQADIAFTAYLLDGADPASRPVTFVFNGGPGSASAWLQVGAIGPWRLPMSGDAAVPSARPELVANADTWLDFTDLVFIDPVGTGYSRFVTQNGDARKQFFSVEGDVDATAVTIRRWLEQANRITSPKFVVGESYGGIRGPMTVWNLQTDQGIGVKGLILVSPVLDFRDFQGSSLLQHVARLPSMAAVAREAKGAVSRADMADVESYAASEYLLDLLKGKGDPAVLDRMSDKVASLIGLDRGFVRHLGGQVSADAFRREFDRANGKVASGYDGTVRGYDPFPFAYTSRFSDALTDALNAPVTSAMIDLYEHRLMWRPDGHYELLNDNVNNSWNWGSGINPPEAMTQLRRSLALDPKLKVLVTHGLFDLVTPYFGSKMLLDQLPVYGSPDRVRLIVNPGGHMFYTRDGSRGRLRDEAKAMIAGS
jgi:carboxypeptidase C (cathepsin A)